MKKFSTFILTTSLLLPLALPTSPVFAANAVLTKPTVQASTLNTISYDQAIARALKYSYGIRNAKEDVDRTTELMDNISDKQVYTPLPLMDPNSTESTRSYSATQSQNDSLYKSSIQTNISYSMKKRQVSMLEDSMTYQTRQAYNAILSASKQKQLADSSVKNAESVRNVMKAKKAVGLASSVEDVTQDGTVEATKKSQQIAGQELEKTYQLFNRIIGMQVTERLVLTDIPKYEPLKETDDVESQVSRVISVAPSLELAQKNIDLARLNVSFYLWNGNDDPYAAKKIDVRKAENNASDAKDQLAEAVRKLYASIRQLEQTHDKLQAQLKVSEEAYRAAKVQYEVGMSTKIELQQRELELEKIKTDIFDTIVKHDNSVQAYLKPWSLS